MILVRGPAADPRVLLGRRAASSRFAPGMYVFPGGVLQAEDFQARAAGALDSSSIGRMGVRGNGARAGALAKAAIRETLEETGLMLGAPGDVGDLNDPGWRAVKVAGLQPSLRDLTYLGLAVTPPGMPLRFNARFFTAPACAAHGEAADSDELSDLRWVSPKQWRAFPLFSITAYILEHFDKILRRAGEGESFVYRHSGGRARVGWRRAV